MSSRDSIEVKGLSHGNNPIPFGSRVGPLVCSGGIMGADPATGKVPEDGADQVRFVFQNLQSFMTAAGGSVDDVAKVEVLLADNSLRGAVNEEWVKVFPDEHSRPARHTTAGPLQGSMLIQLEVIAWVGS
ncbi:MAG: RidA family protein [Acidimicrobiaceae bacterium]|nr:RidA family protein [Acidimicrobiaceae bacterium]